MAAAMKIYRDAPISPCASRHQFPLQKPLGLDFLPNLLGRTGIHPFHLLDLVARQLRQPADEVNELPAQLLASGVPLLQAGIPVNRTPSSMM